MRKQYLHRLLQRNSDRDTVCVSHESLAKGESDSAQQRQSDEMNGLWTAAILSQSFLVLPNGLTSSRGVKEEG